MKSFFNKLFKNTFFQLLGWILSLVLAFITIYDFIHEPKGEIVFDIVGQNELIPAKASMNAKMQIFYNGENIAESKKTIRQYVIKVTNKGDLDVLPAYYNPKIKFGVNFEDSLAIDSLEIQRATQSRHFEAIKPQYDKTKITFENMVFETGDDFIITLNVIYLKDKEPQITPLGIIANTEITVINSYLHPPSKSLFSILFPDNWNETLARIPVYFLTCIGLIFIAAFIISIPFNMYRSYTKWYRKKIFKNKMGITTRDLEEQPKLKLIYTAYTKHGLEEIKRIDKYITHPKNVITDSALHEFSFKREKLQEHLKNKTNKRFNITEEDYPDHTMQSSFLYESLLDIGVITGEADKTKTTTEFKELIAQTIKCLNSKT
ncbi:hypothetical protein [Maridesulfovibrio salexigens]|uniref:Uncharacterized protein n=1 Tax=Maridesulfovibrio salexigens (strain ATCC 14822 / DSM 2638 / NCIMB 8403 / VKM B-1763) TaxID=526222 RepID=C6BS88_MARSD|nr:hypothetical protein [Maridesulfovibrio salexigens]ACS79564.1 hypothetical protein Desal_1502 [Maridesulfovibrio salexigens DSM 2638]